MEAFEREQLGQEHAALGKLYLEFLRVASLSMGLYVLPAGGIDPQSPHTEDEIYYIVAGQATIVVGEQEREVRPGSIIYVAANVPHHFHSIREELQVLVFFAPAEYTLG
jgi:quercetin dioxygenase-like cupin family protein